MICLLCTGAQPTPTNKRKRKRRATASLFLVKKKKKKGGRAWRGAGLTTTSFSLPDCPFSPPLTGKADAVVHSSLPQVNLTFFYPNNNNNRPTIENLSGRFSWSNFGKFVWGGGVVSSLHLKTICSSSFSVILSFAFNVCRQFTRDSNSRHS